MAWPASGGGTDNVWFVHEEGAVAHHARLVERAAQVDVDRVALGLNETRSLQHTHGAARAPWPATIATVEPP